MTPDPLDLDAVAMAEANARSGIWHDPGCGTEEGSTCDCNSTRSTDAVAWLVTRLRAAEAEVARLRGVETWLRGGKDGPSCFDRWICTPNGQEGPVVARHYEAPADLEAPTLAELGAKLADAARTAGA